MPTKKAVVEARESLPAEVIDMAAYAGLGMEEARAEDYAVPILRILQKLSPQVDPEANEYIEGAMPGDILNTVTGEVFPGKEGLLVVPAYFRPEVTEWVPREQGGGYSGVMSMNDPRYVNAPPSDKKPRVRVTPDGHELVDTHNHYVIAVREGADAFPAVISMTSSQLKKSRKFNYLKAQQREKRPNGTTFEAPVFSRIYKFTTIPEENDKGKFYNWNISLIGRINGEDEEQLGLFHTAHAFYEAVCANTVKVAEPVQDEDDEQIPF